jgi:hypothetical protein
MSFFAHGVSAVIERESASRGGADRAIPFGDSPVGRGAGWQFHASTSFMQWARLRRNRVALFCRDEANKATAELKI